MNFPFKQQFDLTEEQKREVIMHRFDLIFHSSTAFIANVTDVVARIAIQSIPAYEKECIRGITMSHINQQAKDSLVESVTRIHRAVTTLTKINKVAVEFYDRMKWDIYYFLKDPTFQSLVDELIERSFCGRCTGNIPPLCLDICGAIIRAVYSPVYTRLRDQLNLLWRVSRRDVEIIRQASDSLFAGISSILDTDEVSLVSVESLLYQLPLVMLLVRMFSIHVVLSLLR